VCRSGTGFRLPLATPYNDWYADAQWTLVRCAAVLASAGTPVSKKRSSKRAGGVSARRAGAGAPGHPARRPGREAGLALSQPVFNDRWQNDVAVATAATAHAMLGEGHTLEQAAALGRCAMAATSKIVEGALAQSPDRPPACRRVARTAVTRRWA
jgi:hypothetical protein